MARTFNPIAPAIGVVAILLALCIPLYAENPDHTGKDAPEIQFGETVLNGDPITGTLADLKGEYVLLEFGSTT